MSDRRRRALLDAWCELLQAGHACCLPVRGRSMSPTLRTGWRLSVRAMPPSRLRVGDIAAFVSGQRLVAHRVVVSLGWGRRRFLIERGDGSSRINRLSAGAVVGRVEEVLDDNGRPVLCESWKWTRARRLAVSCVTLLRYAASRAVWFLISRSARETSS